ncbi:hypothetical protein SASPL_136707 [Salvia splendens]|uniref:Uncharacterized protein n=1 Tax=Salvia splendens TaxID=180675 RepID=A0A8X8ZHT2_SALSN|nr:hypothetical protein SASPL_136707 [Salvia splendens]
MMYRGLPDPYQGQEINRLTLAYFVISGLDIFAALDRFEKDSWGLNSIIRASAFKLTKKQSLIDKQIDCIAVSKKVSAVFFMLAAMFFAAAAAIAAVNANPKKEASGASWAGRARKHKEMTAVMIIGAKFGMGDLSAIHGVARRLELENKSLSETVEDGNKVAAVKKGFEDLVAKVEAYSNTTNWAKDGVLLTIIKHSS